MKLPFVSRAEHDARIADFRASLAIADARAEGAEVRFNVLLEKYHALTLAGGRPTGEIIEEYNLIPQAPPDPMRELIHARAGTSYAKRRMMLAQLDIDRANGLDDDAIRKGIVEGVSSDGVPA